MHTTCGRILTPVVGLVRRLRATGFARWAGPAGLAGLAFLLWWLLFSESGEIEAAHRSWQARLDAMVADRQAAIEACIEYGVAEARTLAMFPSIAYLASGDDGPPYPFPVETGVVAHVRELLSNNARFHKHLAIWVVRPGGEVAVRSKDAPDVSAECLRLAADASRGGPPRIEVHPAGIAPEHLCFAAPVRRTRSDEAAPAASVPVGVVLLAVDPRTYLFPLLDHESMGASTGETVLTARRGAEVATISPRRFAPDRTAPVISATRPIRNAGWDLVSRIEAAEAEADARALLRARTTQAGFGALAFAALLGMLAERDRRRAAQLVAERDNRFAALFHNANDVVLQVGLDGRIRAANRIAEICYGRTAAELIGVHVRELRAPEARATIQADLDRAATEGPRGVIYETIHVRSNGRRMPVEVSSRTFEIEGEKFFLAVVRDLGERRVAEERIRFLNRLLVLRARVNELIVRTPDPLATLPEICIVATTVGAFRKTWVDLAPVEKIGITMAAVADNRTVIAPDLLSAATPIRSRNRVVGAIAFTAALPGAFTTEVVGLLEEIAGDVSFGIDAADDRRSLERTLEELRRMQGNMRRVLLAVEHAGEAILITDRNGMIQYANPALSRMTGHPNEELIGANPRIWKSGVIPDEVYADLWRTVGEGQPWRGVLTNRRKDGRLFDVSAVINPVRDGDGEIVGFVGVQRDITRERQLEAHLNQAQKLEAIGQLAGGIAHDFNNALSGVLGYCDIAIADAAAGRPTDGSLAEIRIASQRASAIARQLLVFSRRQTVELRTANLNEVVDGLLKLLGRILGEGVPLETDLDPKLPLTLADEGQIGQVITNLCLNARDASKGRGSISIATSAAATFRPPAGARVALARAPGGDGDPTPTGGWVVLSVTDRGTGMSEETKARLFEPFFTTKARGQGTGLGLAVVHGIVAQHGGRIVVETGPGQGTTFRVYLPALPQRVIAAHGTSGADAPPRGSERVLVVDDDETARTVTARMLSRLGYDVTSAANGYEALGLAEQLSERIDLLVSDVVMPAMSGPALASALRRSRPDLRALFVSGYPEADLAAQGLDGQPRPLLQKPYTAVALARKVRDVLDAAPALVAS